MVANRDEQIQELEEEIGQKDTHIGQLEGQFQESDTLLSERNATIAHLEEQLHDLNIDLDEAMDHLEWHHAQGPPHGDPPADMDVDEEPEEIQDVSSMDFEGAAPQPPPMGAHSPVSSESSVNDLDDY